MKKLDFDEKRKIVGRLLKERRKEKFTQVQFTQKIKINGVGRKQSFISKYESGITDLSFLEVEAICNSLDIPFKEFVEIYLKKTT